MNLGTAFALALCFVCGAGIAVWLLGAALDWVAGIRKKGKK